MSELHTQAEQERHRLEDKALADRIEAWSAPPAHIELQLPAETAALLWAILAQVNTVDTSLWYPRGAQQVVALRVALNEQLPAHGCARLAGMWDAALRGRIHLPANDGMAF